MWDVVLQVAASFLIGAAVGYGVAAIVEALSRAFARLWENLVAVAKEIFGYVKEATQRYLALIAQFLDNNWDEIETQLRSQLGYSADWIIAIFQEGRDAFLQIAHPRTYQNQSLIFSLGIAEDQAQLPSRQNPIVTRLSLS
ncbi:MAG: hypothetical protein EAZ78_15455 [Oscillatoriales cyanobacterium]|uniref:Uncharacterized protein n=1 Tax=Microcoleus anatoxicus PTRS2 TaxID=2705321 RepID=A0ABU8YU62_9CYAN|nr:MAG: hypothetical protein EA000_01475 [Oscillatoriales cyanobacterium]TAE01239.1 MAG: hypothetical protein EAZ98_03550 [Oscillatoriales cyanobacterium]TAF02235.1 MAG: hypothetical protein EAZ78_15455 [Oscillatoriales cyanobacterium]TAF71673.1 MAG: hypothetical protein EAZ59_00120 [Oscillatoriales cyanobacterium]